MTTRLITPDTGIVAARRNFLRTTGAATLSATAVALIAGCESMAQGTMSNPAGDAATLNVALGLEHEAIMAYQLGAESKLHGKVMNSWLAARNSANKLAGPNANCSACETTRMRKRGS